MFYFNILIAEFDKICKDRHAADLEDIAADEGKSWSKYPDGKLAAIIVIDQMSRNIHRKTGKAFAYDHIGIKLSKSFVEDGSWEKEKFNDQQWILLPFEHQEDIKLIEKCVGKCLKCKNNLELGKRYHELNKDRSEDYAMITQMFINFAQKHLDIMKEFGRYPHRNDSLGRKSTQKEIEYLEEADTFGQ